MVKTSNCMIDALLFFPLFAFFDLSLICLISCMDYYFFPCDFSSEAWIQFYLLCFLCMGQISTSRLRLHVFVLWTSNTACSHKPTAWTPANFLFFVFYACCLACLERHWFGDLSCSCFASCVYFLLPFTNYLGLFPFVFPLMYFFFFFCILVCKWLCARILLCVSAGGVCLSVCMWVAACAGVGEISCCVVVCVWLRAPCVYTLRALCVLSCAACLCVLCGSLCVAACILCACMCVLRGSLCADCNVCAQLCALVCPAIRARLRVWRVYPPVFICILLDIAAWEVNSACNNECFDLYNLPNIKTK